MNEQNVNEEKLMEENENFDTTEPQVETPVEEAPAEAYNATPTEVDGDVPAEPRKKLTKNQLIICAVALVAIIAIVLAIAIPSKFEKVESEALQIAGQISSGDNYFCIDTCPYEGTNVDKYVLDSLNQQAQDKALEAIRYVNSELGFASYVYSDMLETTSLMGRRSEENKKYRVSWTYHPDKGLEVTYEKK